MLQKPQNEEKSLETHSTLQPPPGLSTVPAHTIRIADEKEKGVAVLLPRMPLGLRLISGKQLYESAAGVCRTLGRLAVHQGQLMLFSIPAIGNYH